MAAPDYFNAPWYLAQNPDVAAAVAAGQIDAWTHFRLYGAQEDRAPNAWLHVGFYLQQNPDVAAAVAAGTLTATQHFLLYGAAEARAVNPAVGLQGYLHANPDVADAVQQGRMTALEHLLRHGQHEGRSLGNGILLSDFRNDPVFQAALGIDDFNSALARVEAVAPFMPSFQRPAGWKPAPDTPIPIDFQPVPGKKLKVPDDIRIPDGMVLPDTFEPQHPDDGPPTFSVSVVGGVVHVDGTATGAITIHSDDGGTTLQFTHAGVTAATRPAAADLANGAGLPAAPGFTVDAALFAGLAGKFSAAAASISDAAINDQAHLQAIAQNAAALKTGGFASGITVDYSLGNWAPADLASLLTAYAGTQAQIDAHNLTDTTTISAIAAAVDAGKIAAAKLLNLVMPTSVFDGIADHARINAAIPDGGSQALTIAVDGAGCGCNEIDASSYSKGLILIGGTDDSTLIGGSGNDTFIGRADSDAMMLTQGGSDVIQFGASVAANGINYITDFQAGSLATGGDVLNFGAFVALEGVKMGANTSILKGNTQSIGLFSGGASTNLENFAVVVEDITVFRNMLSHLDGQGRPYLPQDARAIALARIDPANDAAYDIYYLTGGIAPVIEQVGYLTHIDSGGLLGSGLIVANLGIF